MIYLTASRSAPALVVTLSCFAANSLLKGSCSIHLQGALTRLSEFDVFFFFYSSIYAAILAMNHIYALHGGKVMWKNLRNIKFLYFFL